MRDEFLPGLQSSSDLDPGSDTYPSGQEIHLLAFFSALYVFSLHFTHSSELLYDPGLHSTGAEMNVVDESKKIISTLSNYYYYYFYYYFNTTHTIPQIEQIY